MGSLLLVAGKQTAKCSQQPYGIGNSFEERGLIGTDGIRQLNICAKPGLYVTTKFVSNILPLGCIQTALSKFVLTKDSNTLTERIL